MNECLKSNGGCEHYCKNIEGGRICSCKALHTLNKDEHSCDGSISFIAVASGVGVAIILLILIVTVTVCVCKSKKRVQNRAESGPNVIANPL